ncbi:uncharacterized protein LOC109431829 [Aedes albopictus]|uniref:C2H2-type domain-containing protein n=1 Tax=Aedes albopictus TaxID=7160 RepID=A0ABM1ZNB9_AEDAL
MLLFSGIHPNNNPLHIGFRCPSPKCAVVSGNLDELKTHLKKHKLTTSGSHPTYLKCCCGSIQRSLKTLKVHVLKHHPDDFTSANDVPSELEPMDVEEVTEPEDNKLCTKNRFFYGERPTKEELVQAAAESVSKLRSDLALTEAKVKFFMDFCNELLEAYQRFSVGVVADFLSSEELLHNETSKTLLDDLEVSNVFQDVGNPRANLSYLSGKVGRAVPEPVEIELGVRKITETVKYRPVTKGRRKIVQPICKTTTVKDRLHYIPIRQTLSLIFANPEARETLKNENRSSDGIMRGFKDGSLFSKLDFCQKHPFGVRISLHVDDVEYCNPLGSRRGKHKLTVITFKVQNFDPRINSGLDKVYVALMVPSKCVKKYGFEKVLKPLLQDLMALESESGVEINPLIPNPAFRRGIV